MTIDDRQSREPDAFDELNHTFERHVVAFDEERIGHADKRAARPLTVPLVALDKFLECLLVGDIFTIAQTLFVASLSTNLWSCREVDLENRVLEHD